MKNFIKSLTLGLILGCSVTATKADQGVMIHHTVRMLAGTYLCMSNNFANSNGTNSFWYYSYQYGTNVLGGYQFTSLLTNTYPLGVSVVTTNYGTTVPNAILASVPIWPDLNADISPNIALQVIMGVTNNTFPPPNQSPMISNIAWTNPVPWLQQTNNPTFAAATNSFLTVTLNKITAQDGFGIPDTYTNTSANSFTWVINYTGGVLVLSSNLPNNILQGASALALTLSYASTNASSPGAIINGVNLCGWGP